MSSSKHCVIAIVHDDRCGRIVRSCASGWRNLIVAHDTPVVVGELLDARIYLVSYFEVLPEDQA